MNGSMIFEAMTDIDDELIEKAQEYRPRRQNWRVLSTVMAAALVLLVGTFAVTTLHTNQKNSPSASMAVPDVVGKYIGAGSAQKDDAAMNGVQAQQSSPESMNRPESAAEAAGEKEDACAENIQTDEMEGKNETAAMTVFSTVVNNLPEGAEHITVGERYGYEIELREIVMGEYFISEYKIYVTREETSSLLADALLDEQQKKEVEGLVEAYLSKEGLK